MPTKKLKAEARPKKRRIYLTLSDECREQIDAIQAERPELQSVSIAVEWAVRMATREGDSK